MGIGGFFNWMSKKYPSVVVPAKKVDVGFDNLYLDINGIIHTCSHPPNKLAPDDKSDLMAEIAKYIDRLMTLVKPRKLLFISMDGRPPRAKNNKERQEMSEKGSGSVQARESSKDTSYMFFMARMSKELCRYIDSRVNSDPSWKGLAVILSDAEVPGEGEHKIVEYIRRQRVQPQYNANMKHCLFSADADAIILGLTTHEPMFTVLKQLKDDERSVVDDSAEFVFVRVNVLREYLFKDLRSYNLLKQDLEKSIDDWVLLSTLLGNDFLPGLPSVNIWEGAISKLIGMYKKVLEQTECHLNNNGFINYRNLNSLFRCLADEESNIFKNRKVTIADVRGNVVEPKNDRVHKYVMGLTWVLRYYYQGCPCFDWYYPYIQAPPASDFKNYKWPDSPMTFLGSEKLEAREPTGKLFAHKEMFDSGKILTSNGIAGTICREDAQKFDCSQTLVVRFENPQFNKGFVFPSFFHAKAKIPPPILSKEDFQKKRDWSKKNQPKKR